MVALAPRKNHQVELAIAVIHEVARVLVGVKDGVPLPVVLIRLLIIIGHA